MNFRFLVGAVFVAMAMTALLSTSSVVGDRGSSDSSLSKRHSQSVVGTAVVAAMYSASHVDSACIDCFVDVGFRPCNGAAVE